MKKKIFIIIGILAIIGIGSVLYMFNMPHRDVSSTKADYTIEANALVQEFMNNSSSANEKYLVEDGESKILMVSGTIASMSKDQSGKKVIILKGKGEKLGVSVTFTTESGSQLDDNKVGDQITIKGVIRSGAEYDEDLDLGEDEIIEKATEIK